MATKEESNLGANENLDFEILDANMLIEMCNARVKNFDYQISLSTTTKNQREELCKKIKTEQVLITETLQEIKFANNLQKSNNLSKP
jgi:hypothetical protein